MPIASVCHCGEHPVPHVHYYRYSHSPPPDSGKDGPPPQSGVIGGGAGGATPRASPSAQVFGEIAAMLAPTVHGLDGTGQIAALILGLPDLDGMTYTLRAAEHSVTLASQRVAVYILLPHDCPADMEAALYPGAGDAEPEDGS